MPSYIFRGPSGPDAGPIELQDDDHAWGEAVRMLGAMLVDEDGRLPGDTRWRLEVVADAERPVGELIVQTRRTPEGLDA
jgi:hypothetical protein